MIRTFRLTNKPGGMGLSCTSAGLSLAGVPLLQKTEAGFVPRSTREVASLIKAAYGLHDEPPRLHSRLAAIAEALNRGDLARASIAAVLTRTPELSWEAAARLAKVNLTLSKYDPDQPRDWHGRWTPDGGADSARATIPVHEGASDPEQGIDNQDARLTPVDFTAASDDGPGEEPQGPASLEQEFEKKYDDLGPVEFAKAVIQFGSWLEREGKNLSPDEKERALAEYSFLQDRLSFWLGYYYKPPIAQENLISAATVLFQGGVNGGIVGVRDLPQSMVDVAGAAWAVGNAPATIRPAIKPGFETETAEPAEPSLPKPAPGEIEGSGGIVDREKAGIIWGGSIEEQGERWEDYNAEQNPATRKLPPGSKAFDRIDEDTGEAISDKTLNTLSVSYIKKPASIYGTLKRYIDAVAGYDTPRVAADLDPEVIKSKTLQLAIPEYTSPTQWRYLYRAILYGREHGVSVVITKVRE